MSTEDFNKATQNISEVSTAEMLKLINEQDKQVPYIVEKCIPQVAILVEKAVEAINSGHRIIYCGAGTSGRLGVVDAAECPPTYGLSPEKFTAVMAGGRDAVFRAAEGFEDSREAGITAFEENKVEKGDLVIGISVSGQALFVVAFMEKAQEIGCTVAALINNEGAPMSKCADLVIVADTGAEAIKGSTRMKGGTSQKLILNMFSTAVCINLGYVYKNYMVNMKVSNQKLRKRAITMMVEITGMDEAKAEEMLIAHDWDVKDTLKSYFDEEK